MRALEKIVRVKNSRCGEMMKVGVVDYKAGNLKSVETALRHIGANFFISDRVEELSKADKLVIPGVGEARAAMENLASRGLDTLIRDFYRSGRYLLGICIGIQLVFEHSDERDTTCLGLVKGNVVRFPSDMGLKVPQIGWNQVRVVRENPLFKGIESDTSFYFVHSFYPKPLDRSVILSETEYGVVFASSINQNNLYAVQFHPEKSGKPGLKLLENFVEL